MKEPGFHALRRRTLGLLLATCALALPMSTYAQAFPSRTIKLIVPASPGGSSDVMARTLAKVMGEQNNVAVVVENRAGASGSIGVQATVNSAPDGYTIMLTLADATTIYPLTKKVPPYNADKDLTPLAQVAWTNILFSVPASSPHKTIKDFIEASKTQPMAYSSNGHGTTTHLWMEQFKKSTGAQLLHVPYKGAAPALQGMVAGETNIAISSPASAKVMLDGGLLRPLAIGSPERDPAFPDIPTFVESGYPDLLLGVWFGVFGPAGMDADVADKLHDMIISAVKSPEYQKHAQSFMFDLRILSREEFAKLVADDTPLWLQAMEAAGIEPGE
ncbi:tripartite tricarboxylate transporter substrate binding protein [Alcaligenaceae bacterium]|nr:tripartite tricarboxylate transporter substrate binding protein [Alcaligenaceae bacterium]